MGWAPPRAQLPWGLFSILIPPREVCTITVSPGDTDTESKHPALLGAAQQNWPVAWRPGSRAVTGCYLHGAKAALGLCVWLLHLLLMCH